MLVSNMELQFFFNDLDVGACIFYENVSIEISTYHLKAHRISNNMILKLFAKKKGGGGIMVITNVLQNVFEF